MKNAKIVIAGVLLLLAGLAAVLTVSNRPGFTGERIKNSDAYLLDIQRMNGSDRRTLALTAGDVLRITFKTEQGSLHMEITAPDGSVAYAGNGEEATEFEITIPETGLYAITVEARHAEGSVHIQTEEKTK